MNIPFTKQELQRFAENGTLEGHLLSQGLLPLKVLEFVLAEDNLREDDLIAENEKLLERITYLEEYCVEVEASLADYRSSCNV